jgi:hypothetical protein
MGRLEIVLVALATLVVTLVVTPGCESSSGGPADGAATPDGGGGSADHGGGGGDGPGVELGGPGQDLGHQDAKPLPVKWSIAGQQTSVEWDNGRLAAHPTQPKTIAVLLEVTSFTPDIEVAVSSDLGQSIQKTTIKSYSSPKPGHYDHPLGFGFDPSDGSRLALLDDMTIALGSPGPNIDYDHVVFATSTTGGAGFSVSQLATNPWPMDGMKLVGGTGGAKSLLVVRSQHVLYTSDDLGQTLTKIFDDSSKCLAHGDFAVNPLDHTLFLMVCKATLLRCQRSGKSVSCAAATLPAGFEATAVEYSPHDGARVVAAGGGKVATSSDGGKTFVLSKIPSVTVRRIALDPRQGKGNVYVLATGNKVYRSTDWGKSFADVTPPSNMKPSSGGTYARDIAVAADGALIAIAHPGVIRLPPP